MADHLTAPPVMPVMKRSKKKIASDRHRNAGNKRRAHQFAPALGGDGSVWVGTVQPPAPNALCVKDASKSCGLARYNGLKYGNEPLY
jgi:hypothetical protein